MINYEWYQLLNKPLLTPDSWVFMPVWIIIYFTIFLSLIIFILTKSERSKIKGYVLFITQMVLNILWMPAFFMMKSIVLALVVIIFLDVFVILTFCEFKKISKISAYFLIPYIVWILFATYLNAGFLLLN